MTWRLRDHRKNRRYNYSTRRATVRKYGSTFKSTKVQKSTRVHRYCTFESTFVLSKVISYESTLYTYVLYKVVTFEGTKVLFSKVSTLYIESIYNVFSKVRKYESTFVRCTFVQLTNENTFFSVQRTIPCRYFRTKVRKYESTKVLPYCTSCTRRPYGYQK